MVKQTTSLVTALVNSPLLRKQVHEALEIQVLRAAISGSQELVQVHQQAEFLARNSTTRAH